MRKKLIRGVMFGIVGAGLGVGVFYPLSFFGVPLNPELRIGLAFASFWIGMLIGAFGYQQAAAIMNDVYDKPEQEQNRERAD